MFRPLTRQSTAQSTLASSSISRQTQVRTVYIPPGGKSILDRRLPRKLKVGETRPPIYYKFDCKVELSDGSTVTRRSQFPKVEWRYLSDHRNNPRWNPTRTNLKAAEADAGGRMAKFQRKYGFSGVGDAKPQPAKTTKTSEKKQEAVSPKAEATPKEEDAPVKSSKPAAAPSSDYDFEDLMGENFVPVQSGGRVAQRRKKSKK